MLNQTNPVKTGRATNVIKVNSVFTNAKISIAADGYDPGRMVSLKNFRPVHLADTEHGGKDLFAFTNQFPSMGAAQQLSSCPVKDKAGLLLDELEFDDLSAESKDVLCAYIFRNIIGRNFIFIGPFGKIRVTYVDYIASGRPLKCFELYIRQHVLPTYSNTHTESSYNAQQTSHFRDEARNIIRECVNALDEDAIIFTGSGATAAINKLVHAMNIKTVAQSKGVTVFVGPYEHHSNILPWRELKARDMLP